MTKLAAQASATLKLGVGMNAEEVGRLDAAIAEIGALLGSAAKPAASDRES